MQAARDSWDAYPWEEFDSQLYADTNYGEMREDDRQFVAAIQDAFVAADLPRLAAGLDVGPGPNLYPALAMLPFCETITLWEYASPNIRWLEREVRAYSSLWDPFWDVLSRHPRYGSIDDPRAALAAKAMVRQGSALDLPVHQWDVGTMMFVAESFSASREDFDAAVLGFVRALRPGAQLAIGFMERSQGYFVGEHRYPAVDVCVDDVRAVLEPVTERLDLLRVGKPGGPLREGYDGMILATGRVGGG
jgi:hypothetical protein